MGTVVDSHVHIFPYLGGASGFPSDAEHRQFLQLYMATHGEPVRRLRDHVQVNQRTLHDGRLDSLSSLREVNFRAGRFGRFEWTCDNEDLYLQFFPPSLQSMESPPDFMLQQMARAGVDRAVLQNARLYGRLNDYFAAAVQTYPDRFIGLADVDEVNAYTDAEITGLRRAVREQSLRGLYYANRALIKTGYARGLDDRAFDVFWESVRDLGIPVFWEIVGIPDPNSQADLLREIERLNRWAERWPEIRGVWTHGFAPELLERMPPAVEELLRRDQFMVEILYPIHWGRTHEYPFAELRPALQTLHQHVGGERLVWGSDMPNVERNCTYRQSLEYLRFATEGWLPSVDLDRILGANVMQILSERVQGAKPLESP
ncbi:MAG: amidohydrolase family protein [Chloroflexi bacterium]|nr:amidohydrolase family protein [Chloroflexota bacterium]